MSRMVITVADTVLGYGSSQILGITKSIADALNMDHLIFQPFVPHRKVVELSNLGYRLETLPTLEHPWSFLGRNQYLKEVASKLNKIRPEVLILPNYVIFPILEFLKYKPALVIHLALEDMEQFGEGPIAHQLVSQIYRLTKKIDLWIFPERNRAIQDCHLLGIPYDKVCIFYNVSNQSFEGQKTRRLNNRLLYAGSVDFDRTVAHYFPAEAARRLPIDVFGSLSGNPAHIENFKRVLKFSDTNLRYFGELPLDLLNKEIVQYAYSLVYWFPMNWALRNAAPNKFFQAISAKVPVLAAPHPQCVSFIERYGCGIVLKDWEFSSFIEGVEEAIEKIETPDYEVMVEGCMHACQMELNWDKQFKNVLVLIEEIRKAKT